MKLTLLLIPLLLFMTSCTIDWNDEKDKKIAELEKQLQEQTIMKIKKDTICKSLLPEIKNQVENTINTEQVQRVTKIEDIFYSPYMNDCVYITNEFSQNTYTYKTLFLVTTKFGYSPSFLRCERSSINPEGCNSFDFWLQKIKGMNESIPTKLDFTPVSQI